MMKRMNGKHRRISRKAPRLILKSLKRLEPSSLSLDGHWCQLYAYCGSCATCANSLIWQKHQHVEKLFSVTKALSNFIRLQLKEKTGELIDSSWKEQRNRHLLMKMLELEEPTVTAKVKINFIRTFYSNSDCDVSAPAEMVKWDLNSSIRRWLTFCFKTVYAIFYLVS